MAKGEGKFWVASPQAGSKTNHLRFLKKKHALYHQTLAFYRMVTQTPSRMPLSKDALMKETDDHKFLTLNAYNNSAQEFAKNTEALHPEEKAKKFLNLLLGNRILDLGCGPGRDAKVFVGQGFQVVGVDLSPQMIEMARSRVAAQFHVMDIESLDFPANCFHGIWASASLLHIPKKNILQVFKTLYSLLVEGGIFYFSLKKGIGEGLQADPRYGDVQKFWSFFEKEEIEEVVNQTNFKVIESVISEKKANYQGHPLWINVLCKKEKK